MVTYDVISVIRLHLAKVLIEAYGGRIRADDRVPGDPGKGAAIWFTLKKARRDR